MKTATIMALLLLASAAHAQSRDSTAPALDQGDKAARAGEAVANSLVMSKENQIPATPTFEERVRQKAQDLGTKAGEAFHESRKPKRATEASESAPPDPTAD